MSFIMFLIQQCQMSSGPHGPIFQLYTVYGSDKSFWAGAKLTSGTWLWTSGETVTTFPSGQPGSGDFSKLARGAGFSLASSAEDSLYALCEGKSYFSCFYYLKQSCMSTLVKWVALFGRTVVGNQLFWFKLLHLTL